MLAYGQSLNGGDAVYSPWFPRQGNHCVFRAEQIKSQGGSNLTVKFYHKNAEDTGNGTHITGKDIAFTSDSVGKSALTDLKELVRVRFDVSGTGSAVSRMLQPVWYNANCTQ